MDRLPEFKLKEPLLILVGAILIIWWALNAFNTGNALWFLPFQPTYQPSRIIVRHYGTAVTLQPGMNGYLEITDALNQSLSAFKNTSLVPLGLSDETMRRYNEEELALEVYYPSPIRFNTPIRMNQINQLLIPIDGTHDGAGNVFLGSNGYWLAGVLQMQDSEPLLAALRQLGYLTD
jgi:hypothetical protein